MAETEPELLFKVVRELGLNSLLFRNDLRLKSFNILDHDWSLEKGVEKQHVYSFNDSGQ